MAYSGGSAPLLAHPQPVGVAPAPGADSPLELADVPPPADPKGASPSYTDHDPYAQPQRMPAHGDDSARYDPPDDDPFRPSPYGAPYGTPYGAPNSALRDDGYDWGDDGGRPLMGSGGAPRYADAAGYGAAPGYGAAHGFGDAAGPSQYQPVYPPGAAESYELHGHGLKDSNNNPSTPAAPPRPDTLREQLMFASGLSRLLVLARVQQPRPRAEQVARKRNEVGGQRFPVMMWTLTISMVCVFIYELVAQAKAQGSPIATKPTFNYMIGPSSTVLINVGARFTPCMKYVQAIPPTMELACPSDTSAVPTDLCSIEELCGHGGFGGGNPDQTWRFLSAVFMHVGFIHLGLNMLAQWILGGQIERMIGSLPFIILYIAGGLYGNILGGNFALPGIPSMGASGAIMALCGCDGVNLAMHWKYEQRPVLKLVFFVLTVVIMIGMGYIPAAVDGLAHLGGLAMGILLSVWCVPAVFESNKHYRLIWVARVAAVPLILVAFILTTKNFFTDDPNAKCTWCKYLSCIPTSANNRCSGTGLTTVGG